MNEEIEKECVSLTERIVMLYANFTGRDEEHRAEFRDEVFNTLYPALSLHDKKLAETIRAEKLKPQSLSELYAPEEINIWNKALELAAQVIEGKEGV